MSDTAPTLSTRVLGDELLTREQVAELLDLSPLTVTRMISRGEFPCVRFARRIRVRASDVRIWLRARTSSTYRGPTDEEREALELERTLHDACRCTHVAQTLAALLSTVTSERGGQDMQDPPPTSEPSEPQEKLLDAKEVAEMLHVSLKTVSRMLATGALPALRAGRKRLVRATDLEKFLQATEPRVV